MMSNEIPVIDAVFGHYFDSCQISSSELDHTYKEVRNSVADEDVVALIDTLCLACEIAAFKAGIKAGFKLSQELE
jgi:hypothetical protein